VTLRSWKKLMSGNDNLRIIDSSTVEFRRRVITMESIKWHQKGDL